MLIDRCTARCYWTDLVQDATGQVWCKMLVMDMLDARCWSRTDLVQDASHEQPRCKMLVMDRHVQDTTHGEV
jgi:hypothetical protein